jgi:glutaconate CoA-transferase subunit B
MVEQYAEDYTLAELMCIEAARLLPRAGVAFLGLGLPVLSGTLARCLYAPEVQLCTEVGALDWRPDPVTVPRAPIGIHDLLLNDGAAMVSDMVDALGTVLMGGRVTFALLTGAQIDKYGNVNTLVLGEYSRPQRRLAGTGGNTEISCLAPQVFVLMPQEPRRWAERVDFITSPGYIEGPGARRRAGLEPQGPNRVISTMGVYRYDTPDGGDTGSCELVLEAVFPHIDAETIRALVPWELKIAAPLREVEPPTLAELAMLRRLDPFQYYLTPGRY